MRLITSTKSTILAPISKYAFSYIQQLRETMNHTISSTSKFINEISRIKTENNTAVSEFREFRTLEELLRNSELQKISKVIR